jgi:hypothetical protein
VKMPWMVWFHDLCGIHFVEARLGKIHLPL